MALAKASMDRGEFFLGEAFASPTDGAAIVFKGSTQDVANAFANEDPYAIHGLVTAWYVREWTTIAEKDAEQSIVTNAMSHFS